MSLLTNVQDARGQWISTNATVTANEFMPSDTTTGGASWILHAGDMVGIVYQGYQSEIPGVDFIEVIDGNNGSSFVAFGEGLYLLPDGSFLSEYSTTSPTKGHAVVTAPPGGGDDGDDGSGDGHGSGHGLGIFNWSDFLGLGIDLTGWKSWVALAAIVYLIANHKEDGKRSK